MILLGKLYCTDIYCTSCVCVLLGEFQRAADHAQDGRGRATGEAASGQSTLAHEDVHPPAAGPRAGRWRCGVLKKKLLGLAMSC